MRWLSRKMDAFGFNTIVCNGNSFVELEQAFKMFDRWFLDRIATHILDYQDEGKVEFFEGNFTEYEEYKKRTLGADALEPKRIKYKRIAK